MPVRPFRVDISEHVLVDLRERLGRTRWPDEITGSGWEHGASLPYLKELADYWLHKFDWRRIEREINAYPNFIGEIDGHKIHFLHIKGRGKRSIPLIITHGWPGSFLEMMKLVPLLTDHDDLTFDLVVPSLLGYGFSEKITSPGCNAHLMGELWYKLMRELKYDRYGVQGGDFGASVSTVLALRHPEQVTGLHMNYIESYYRPYIPPGESKTPEEIQFDRDNNSWYDREGAYAHQQRTKPLTLAYGLNDSPMGLCAWIIEKFHGWADCRGNVENIFTKDELLANVTLYWVTQTLHSSIRLYNEMSRAPLYFGEDDFVKVPVGIARFPLEDPFPPRKYVERGFNVQRWTTMSAGGHFAAMEKPELLAGDIREFFRGIAA